jgi:hypothetical protein
MRRLWTPLYFLLTSGWLSWFFRDWAYDDIFITYRYAENLASGLGMVYNAGERVLSTTSPLWAVLLAPAAALNVELRTAAIVLGALALAAGGYCLWQIGQAARQPWIAWAGLLLYPLHPLVTGTLGSETPLYLALGLGALALHLRGRPRLAAACAGLAAAARPDGLLFAAVIGLDGLAQTWFARRSGPRSPWPWAAVGSFLLVWLPWVLWAWAYYGSPLPVTLAAKQAQGTLAVSQSFWGGFWQTLHTSAQAGYFRLELVLALGGAAYLAGRLARGWRGGALRTGLADLRPLGLLLGWTVAYFVAYTALGVTRYFWYYAPLLPALTVGIGLGLEALGQAAERIFPPRSMLLSLGLPALVCAGLVLAQGQALAHTAPDARMIVYRQAGEWLRANTPPEASVGTLEVGLLGTTSQRRMLDFAGLLQPETAAQLSVQGSYDRTALWVVQRYHPEVLVLQEGLFGELESWLRGTNCTEVKRFPDLKWEMVVYTCAW